MYIAKAGWDELNHSTDFMVNLKRLFSNIAAGVGGIIL